ncbi:MAG TPA: serine/threonine-protein kinase, partial [Gemmatimonadales bacterium]
GETDYLVMELLEGETLAERLRRGPLPGPELLRLGVQIADALDRAHRAGVVHRDIKPENILLQAGHAVVADFGIARAITAAADSRMTSGGVAVGTPYYMSPEQAAGDEHIDGRSDIYSLGCVAFEMLVGEPPFSGTTPQEVLAKKLVDRPNLAALEAVPGPVAGAVRRALARLPDDRFPTAADFGAAMATPGPSSLGRRRRVPLIYGLATAFAVAALSLWWVLLRPPPPGVGASLDPTHIAVLYFEVLNDSARVTPIAAGLTEDLIDQLGQVERLSVVPPEGVRPYRSGHALLDSIARRLQVGAIVSGSVARSDGRLRVMVRLIDAADSRQLNSRVLDQPEGELFALEDTLAVNLAEFLRQWLGSEVVLRERRAGTKSVQAWELVQRAEQLRMDVSQLLLRHQPEDALRELGRTDSLLATAESLDRGWIVPIVARADLARAQAVSVWEEGFGSPAAKDLLLPSSRLGVAFRAHIQTGLGHAARALAIHRGAPEALAVRGRLLYQLYFYYPAVGDTLRDQAERDLTAAVAAKPTLAAAWYSLSALYQQWGRLAEADAAARHALDADAFLREAPGVTGNLFFSALEREDFATARYWCAQGARRFPTSPNFADCELRLLGWTADSRRQIASAWDLLARAERLDSNQVLWADRRLMVAAVIARAGLAESAKAVLGRIRAGVTNPVVRDDMMFAEGYVWLLLGERDHALALLARYLAANPQYRQAVARSPWWRPLHADPRFLALLRSSP